MFLIRLNQYLRGAPRANGLVVAELAYLVPFVLLLCAVSVELTHYLEDKEIMRNVIREMGNAALRTCSNETENSVRAACLANIHSTFLEYYKEELPSRSSILLSWYQCSDHACVQPDGNPVCRPGVEQCVCSCPSAPATVQRTYLSSNETPNGASTNYLSKFFITRVRNDLPATLHERGFVILLEGFAQTKQVFPYVDYGGYEIYESLSY